MQLWEKALTHLNAAIMLKSTKYLEDHMANIGHIDLAFWLYRASSKIQILMQENPEPFGMPSISYPFQHCYVNAW